MRLIYASIYTLLFIVSLPFLAVRCLVNPVFFRHLKARFAGPGRILPKLDGRPRVWIWALSLGEVLSAREMARRLSEGGADVVVTSTTLAGFAMARQLFPDLTVLPSPLDFRLSVRRFLDCVDPDFLILVETDVWPGVLMELKRRGVDAAFAGARLSPSSFKNYRRVRFFWSKVLALFGSIAVQTEEDLSMFLELGADPAKIRATGNLKFDEEPMRHAPDERRRILEETGWPDGRWLIGGSVHPGEDFMLLELFRLLSVDRPELRLLVAPRDRHRFGAFRRHAREAFPGETACRSRPSPEDGSARVFVLDTLGELRRFYLLGECALIGKSWPGRHEGGGHNPLEPALLGVPSVSGPRIHNFKWMYRALCAEGGAVIADRRSLPGVMRDLLDSPGKLSGMGIKAKRFAMSHRGAVARTLDFIRPPGWRPSGDGEAPDAAAPSVAPEEPGATASGAVPDRPGAAMSGAATETADRPAPDPVPERRATMPGAVPENDVAMPDAACGDESAGSAEAAPANAAAGSVAGSGRVSGEADGAVGGAEAPEEAS
ncbi:MAG: hypothetical protein LBR80_15620 [Deltaproteobacteria bacterium]|jgi:3-deoxy-D-manno-octulosonic-acid transferase|nr:hypothetical protein [Deltaproteobacteria bacterium]